MKQHTPLFIILSLHLILTVAYASLIPLGEAPDEPAHLTYAQFVAKNDRLPATLDERQEASYRSTWPPLYHILASVPVKLVGNTPPTHLKSVGDTPRRLIPTNGQTIASFIHTADEAWPWRGITLAWHLGRYISVVLTTLAVGLTYAIAWRLTQQRLIAASAAALHAFLPQALFIGGVVNDDNLLIFLSGLVLFTLIGYTQQNSPPRPVQFFYLGALLGLAIVAKYNALPLWIFTVVWIIWLTHTKSAPPTDNLPIQRIRHSLVHLSLMLAGAMLTSGWWFIYIWRNFNQVETRGLISGSLTALNAGTADASLRQLASGGLSITLPALTVWLEWFITFFKSFWGLFGGGSTIELPGWVYWAIAALCLAAIGSLVAQAIRHTRNSKPSSLKPDARLPTPYFLLLIPLFFIPLPLIRFMLSGNVVETAQGRHLFPALPVIALGLILGFAHFAKWVSGYGLRNPYHVLHTSQRFTLIPPLLAFVLSFYSLKLILESYPPFIPLRTTADVTTVENQIQANLTESVRLIGYELGQPEDGILPITLVWLANAIPTEDYLINLSLTDPTGQPLGGWIGHPIGGRYPTRAWDEGDILRDTIPIPILSDLPTGEAIFTLSLLNIFNEPVTSRLTTTIHLPIFQSPNLSTPLPISPHQLRADGLSPSAPFSYRSTLSFILPGHTTPPKLVAPNGQTFAPTSLISNSAGSIAHFIVAANWPNGNYQLSITGYQLPIHIINRPRQFDLPSISHILDANFGDQITVLGYDLPQNRVQPGQRFSVTLHLQAKRTMGRDLVIFNHLLDDNAVQRGGADRIPQNYYTTLLWVPDEIVSDSYEVSVEASAPPGVYWLDVGLYPADQPGFSLPLVVGGQPIDRSSISLGPIKVGGSPPEIALSKAQPQNPINISFGGEITLLGFNLTDASGNSILLGNEVINPKSTPALRAGASEIRNLKLFWQANTIPRSDYTVFVHLLDPEGNLVAQADRPPAAGAYPTSLWDAGEIIVDERPLPELAAGHYKIQVGLYRPDTGERLPAAGSPNGAVKLAEFEIIQ